MKIVTEGVDWQVNWGKHQPARFRLQNVLDPHIDNQLQLPVVVVRDPWTWLQSMCRVRYSAHWFHVVERNPGDPYHCPNLVPNHVDWEWLTNTTKQSKAFVQTYYHKDVWKVDNVMERANFTMDSTQSVPLWTRYKSGNMHHDSLAHMWKDWYQDYFDNHDLSPTAEKKEGSYPRLMVRLEDLVFTPEPLLRSICACVNGTFGRADGSSDALTLVATSAKGGDEGAHIHGHNRTTLADAMIQHIHVNRTKGMTEDDIVFAQRVFGDSPVMEAMGYRNP